MVGSHKFLSKEKNEGVTLRRTVQSRLCKQRCTCTTTALQTVPANTCQARKLHFQSLWLTHARARLVGSFTNQTSLAPVSLLATTPQQIVPSSRIGDKMWLPSRGGNKLHLCGHRRSQAQARFTPHKQYDNCLITYCFQK